MQLEGSDFRWMGASNQWWRGAVAGGGELSLVEGSGPWWMGVIAGGKQ